MKTTYLIDDFSAGEVSPLTEAKIASSDFKDGLALCENMMPYANGPLLGRDGFEHMASLDFMAVGDDATIGEIAYTKTQIFICVFTDLKLTVYDELTGTLLLDTTTPYTEEQLHGADGEKKRLHMQVAPAGLELVCTVTEHPPHRVLLTLPADVNDPIVASFEEITFDWKPDEWKENSWPNTMTFYQNRSWWGGCKLYPDHFWGSRSFKPYDMTQKSQEGGNDIIYDTDGIAFELSHHGLIKWIAGGKNLLVGTEAREYIVTSSQGGYMSPTDTAAEPQSAYGSKHIKPKMIGSELAYVTSDGRKLRTMWWKWIESGWTSLDATRKAEHITVAGIKSITFSRNPNQTICMLKNDGTLVQCMFDKDPEDKPVIGWFRVVSQKITFHAIAATEHLGVSRIWAVVENAGVFSLVRQKHVDYQEGPGVFLDDYTTYDGPAISHVDSTRNFPGGEITVIADGFYIPNVSLNPDGSFDLDIPAKVIHYGYGYSQKFRIMPLLAKGSKDSGAVGQQHKRWVKVFLRVIKSYRPMVNGVRPPERHVHTNDDTAEPYENAFIQCTPKPGWSRDGTLEIEQDLPFRLIVTGIYGDLNIEDF